MEQNDGERKPLSPEQLKGRALAMLTRREHSQVELQRKLLEQGALPEQVNELLEELVTRNLQSDERFAEVYIRSRAVRGYGPLVITAELKTKGMMAEQVAEALEASGYDWDAQASEVRARRFGAATPQSPKEKAKQYRFLQYRGFSGQAIKSAMQGGFADDFE